MGENSASGLTRCALGGTGGESAGWQGTGRGRVGVPGRLGSLPLGAVPPASRVTDAWWPGVWCWSPGWETGGRSLMAKGNCVSSWSSMDRLENCDRRQQSFIRFIRKSHKYNSPLIKSKKEIMCQCCLLICLVNWWRNKINILRLTFKSNKMMKQHVYLKCKQVKHFFLSH